MTIDLTPWRGTCDSCSAQIAWAVTDTGKAMPVDLEPSPRGNVILAVKNTVLHAGVLGVNRAAGARQGGQQLHLSHFATCPYAGQYRRRKERR